MSDDGHAILERYLSLDMRSRVQKGGGGGGGGALVMCGCKAMARDRVWERDVPCSVKFGLSHYSRAMPRLAVC